MSLPPMSPPRPLRRRHALQIAAAGACGLIAGLAPRASADDSPERDVKLEKATLGGGCFWCIEAVFQQVKGVHHVVSGYTGGHLLNPTYQAVLTGRTGHAEVCAIEFDPQEITFEEILEVFFAVHDPTTKNRQGNDRGPQYRSAIFYHSEEQKRQAEATIQRLNDSGTFRRKIVTEVEPATVFYRAEEYHQNYFVKNPFAGYCQAVVRPKVLKFQQQFGDKVKEAPAGN